MYAKRTYALAMGSSFAPSWHCTKIVAFPGFGAHEGAHACRGAPPGVPASARFFCAIGRHGQRHFERAMFEFLKTGKDPLADVRSAQRWLMLGVSADALALHEELMVE